MFVIFLNNSSLLILLSFFSVSFVLSKNSFLYFGIFFFSDECLLCNISCKTSNDNCKCDSCEGGYYLKNYQCINCAESYCKECPDGYDASDIYQKFGKKGIKKLLQRAEILDEFEMVSIAV